MIFAFFGVSMVYMEQQTKVLEFVSFCIEMYAQAYAMSGADVVNLFEQKHVLDYLFANYTELHTQGKEYIVPLLHGFIGENN